MKENAPMIYIVVDDKDDCKVYEGALKSCLCL